MEQRIDPRLQPSCSKASEDMEADATEDENIDKDDEETEFNMSVEQEEEAVEEQDDVDENEVIAASKISADIKNDDADLFNDFEFGTSRTEENPLNKEDVTSNVGGWADGSKVCSAAVNLNRKFICVDYPGVIKNVDRAIATLGGAQTIAKCIEDDHRLELSFRPNDPYCKPVISSVYPSRNLLLKVRHRRKPGSDEFEYQLEVLGAVDNIYKFDKMCDFQYLPIVKLPNGQYKEILSSIRPKIDDEREEYLSRKVPLFLPPYCFSRREAPTNFFFENEVVNEKETTLGNDRKKRYLGVIHRSYNNPDIPVKPDPAAVENVNKLPEHQKALCETISNLFKVRPLWIKTAILARMDSSHHRLIKHFLPVLAFYIETGPWRNLWCKFGYDPRKNPEAKIYQTLDFRLRTTATKNQVEAKRGMEAPRFIHSTKKNLPVHKTPIHHVEEREVTETVKKPNPDSLDLTYIFHPDYRPPYRQMRYQVCDVMHDQVQKLLHENDGKETECTERDGWCIPDFTDMCRDIMSEAVEKLFSS